MSMRRRRLHLCRARTPHGKRYYRRPIPARTTPNVPPFVAPEHDFAITHQTHCSMRRRSPVVTLTCVCVYTLQAIMHALLEYIKKDRFADPLVEKLCLRFDACDDDPRQWRNLAFCLAQARQSPAYPAGGRRRIGTQYFA